MNRLHPSEKLTARTDEAGRVRFKLHQNGSVADQGRAHGRSAGEAPSAGWVSYWASMTFELKDGPGRVS